MLQYESDPTTTKYGKTIYDALKARRPVPSKLVCHLVKLEMINYMIAYKEYNLVFVIDGYPYNEENMKCWEKTIAKRVNVLGSIYIDIDRETCLLRGQSRINEASRKFEDLNIRFDYFLKCTKPTIDKLQNVVQISGLQPIENVIAQTEKIIDNFK